MAGRDHAVAVQQGRAEDAERNQHRPAIGQPRRAAAAAHAAGHQRRQGQHTALALVVGAHHQRDVLDRDDEEERVDDERQHAEHVVVGGRHGVRAEETLAQRVQRAGADVAVDDAERRQRQREQAARLAVRLRPSMLSGANRRFGNEGTRGFSGPGSARVCQPFDYRRTAGGAGVRGRASYELFMTFSRGTRLNHVLGGAGHLLEPTGEEAVRAVARPARRSRLPPGILPPIKSEAAGGSHPRPGPTATMATIARPQRVTSKRRSSLACSSAR